MQFIAYGHENITGKHKTTIEFTKDKELTKEGDCIIGINANFSLKDIKPLLKLNQIKITIKVDNLKEEITAKPNENFNSNKEIVIRMGDFKSERTLAINADKSCKYLNRELIKKLTNPKQKITITIS